MDHLHSFKAKSFYFSKERIQISNPLNPMLDNIPWVNYYNEDDPVSGYLDFYNMVPGELPMFSIGMTGSSFTRI